jgi:hypothetical protein
LSEIAPVPVENVPVPICDIFPRIVAFPEVDVFPPKDVRPEPLRGFIKISPVVLPPIVRVLLSVVWIDLRPAANVRFPEIEAFPLVVKFPFSFTTKVLAPPDWISIALLFAPFISLITKAVARPSFVSVREVLRPVPKVNAIFLPTVVVIVLPVLYAACNPNGAPVH